MRKSKDSTYSAIEAAALALQKKQIEEMYAVAEADKKKHQFTVQDSDSADESQTFIVKLQFNEHSSTLSDGGHTTDEDGSGDGAPHEDQTPNTYTVILSSEASTSAGSSPATPADAQSCQFTVMQPTTASPKDHIVVKCEKNEKIDPKAALRLQLMVVFRHLAANTTAEKPLSEIHFHKFTGLPEGVTYSEGSDVEEGVAASSSKGLANLKFIFTKGDGVETINADNFILETLRSFKESDALGDHIQSVDSLNVFMPGESRPLVKTSTAADTDEKGSPAVRGPKSRHATGSQTWFKWLGGMAVISTIPGLANYFSKQDSNDETHFSQGFLELIKEIDGEGDSAIITQKTNVFLQGLNVTSLGKDEFDLLKLLSKNASSDSCSAESMNPLVNSSPTTPQPAMADAVSHFLTKAKEELAQQLESYTEVTSANVQEVHQRIQDVKDLDIGIDTSGLEQQLEDFKAAFVNYTEVTSANAQALDQRIKDANGLNIGLDTSGLEQQLEDFKAAFVNYTEVTSANAQAVGQRIKDANGLNIGLDTSGLEQQLEDFETQKQQLIERLAKVPTTQEEATALEADIESAKAMGLGGDGDSVVATAKQQLEDFGTRKQQLIEQLAGYTEVTPENAETVRELIANANSIGVEVPDTLTKSLGYFQTQKLNLEQQSQTLTSAVEAFNSEPSVESFEQIITQSELLKGQPYGSEYSSPVVKNITADAMRTFISESPDHIRGFDGLGLNGDCRILVNEQLGKVAQFLESDLKFLKDFSPDNVVVSDLERLNLIESRCEDYPQSYAEGIKQSKLTGLLQEARYSLSSIREEYKQACDEDYTHKDQLQGLKGQIAAFNSRGIDTQALQQKRTDLESKISEIEASLANTFPRDPGGALIFPSSPCSLSDREALLDKAKEVGIDVTDETEVNESYKKHMKKLEETLSNPSADLKLEPIRTQLANLQKLIGEQDVAALKIRFDSVSQQTLKLRQQSQRLNSAVEAFNSKPSVESFGQIITLSEELKGQPNGSEYSSPVVEQITKDAMTTFIREYPDHIRGFDGLGLNGDCRILVNEQLGKVAQFLESDLKFLKDFSPDNVVVSDLERLNLIDSRCKDYPESYTELINQGRMPKLLQEARDSLSSIREEYKQACDKDYTHKDQLQGLEDQISAFNSRGIETQVLQQKNTALKGEISAIQTSLANTFPRDQNRKITSPLSPCSLSDREALLDKAKEVGIDVTDETEVNESYKQHMEMLEGTLSNPSADLKLEPIRTQLANLQKLIGEEDVAALKTRFDKVSQVGQVDIEGLDYDFSVVPHVGAHKYGNDSLLISGHVQDYSSSVANGGNIPFQYCLSDPEGLTITDAGELQNDGPCAKNRYEALSQVYNFQASHPEASMLPGRCFRGTLTGDSIVKQDAFVCFGEPSGSKALVMMTMVACISKLSVFARPLMIPLLPFFMMFSQNKSPSLLPEQPQSSQLGVSLLGQSKLFPFSPYSGESSEFCPVQSDQDVSFYGDRVDSVWFSSCEQLWGQWPSSNSQEWFVKDSKQQKSISYSSGSRILDDGFINNSEFRPVLFHVPRWVSKVISPKGSSHNKLGLLNRSSLNQDITPILEYLRYIDSTSPIALNLEERPEIIVNLAQRFQEAMVAGVSDDQLYISIANSKTLNVGNAMLVQKAFEQASQAMFGELSSHGFDKTKQFLDRISSIFKRVDFLSTYKKSQNGIVNLKVRKFDLKDLIEKCSLLEKSCVNQVVQSKIKSLFKDIAKCGDDAELESIRATLDTLKELSPESYTKALGEVFYQPILSLIEHYDQPRAGRVWSFFGFYPFGQPHDGFVVLFQSMHKAGVSGDELKVWLESALKNHTKSKDLVIQALNECTKEYPSLVESVRGSGIKRADSFGL